MVKRIFGMTVLLISMICLLSFSAQAVPKLINCQGRLTDSEGVSLSGTYMIRFKLFADVTGGSALWSEQQDVTIVDGIYNVQLGSVNALSVSLFDQEALYLEVEIFHSSTGWETLSPRQQLTSAAFAINADRLDGVEAADLEESHEIDNKINTHASNENAHHTKTTSFSELTDTATDEQIPDDITIHYATSAGDADTLDGMDAMELAPLSHNHDAQYYEKADVDSLIAALESRIAQLEDLLEGVTRTGQDIEFSGVNVHIVNGQGTTDGAVNGFGNLIVGYNELRPSDNDRSGSHNVVIGKRHNYTSYGGLVVGSYNTISGTYASVSGGYNNTASNAFSSVSGGQMNIASGNASSVSGGQSNTASSGSASISGGSHNTANGGSSSISGGYNNTASNSFASVSGGHSNTANGNSSSVSGGRNNDAIGSFASVAGGGGANDDEGNSAFGYYSSILGGRSNIAGDPNLTIHTVGLATSICGGSTNTASGDYSSVSGGYSGKASGQYSSISGGWYNRANGTSSTISGGYSNKAQNDYASVSGGQLNEASGYSSSVSGGANNTASGINSSVSGGGSNIASGGVSSISGGSGNTASGSQSSMSGGQYNTASGEASSVSGGYQNEASGEFSMVSAGHQNTADGTYSSVSGGDSRSVYGQYDWRAGGLVEDH